MAESNRKNKEKKNEPTKTHITTNQGGRINITHSILKGKQIIKANKKSYRKL